MSVGVVWTLPLVIVSCSVEIDKIRCVIKGNKAPFDKVGRLARELTNLKDHAGDSTSRSHRALVKIMLANHHLPLSIDRNPLGHW